MIPLYNGFSFLHIPVYNICNVQNLSCHHKQNRFYGNFIFDKFLLLPTYTYFKQIVITLFLCIYHHLRHIFISLSIYNANPLPSISFDPGMSLNCAPTRVCRKSASRPGYVVKLIGTDITDSICVDCAVKNGF